MSARLRIGVIGHVEHVTLGTVAAVPRAGEIAHLADPRVLPGGGGGIAFFQLANGPAEVHLYTALGNDEAAAFVRGRLAALRGSSLDVELGVGSHPQPASVRLSSPAGRDAGASFDLVLRLEQVETNVAVPDEAFTVRVPADAVPMTLEELRQAGPLRDRSAS